MTRTHRAALLALFAFVAPLVVFADNPTPNPGCHIATQQEQAELIARGIPVSFQICPKDRVLLGIGQNFDQWYAQIRSTSPCNRNTCTLACRTRNTGAQVCSAISRSWNSIGCHPVNNTAIFPSIAYGFAAHIDLLRRYCGQYGRCTINSVVTKWAPAADGNNPAAYAAFVSRYAGVPSNEVFDPNNIDLMGRLAVAMSCMENGSLPYDVNELKQGLLMAAGGPRQPVPGNVGQLLQESLTSPYSVSQPAAGVTPFFGPTGAGAAVTGYPATQLPPPTPPAGTQNFGGSLSQNAAGIPAASTGIPTVTNIPPAATFLALPPASHPGQNVLLVWATVGMSATQLCSVSYGGNQVGAAANAGSARFVVPNDASGQLTVLLQCTSAGGSVTRDAVINVQ